MTPPINKFLTRKINPHVVEPNSRLPDVRTPNLFKLRELQIKKQKLIYVMVQSIPDYPITSMKIYVHVDSTQARGSCCHDV